MKNKFLIIMGALMMILFTKQISGFAFFGDEYNPNSEEVKKSIKEDRKWSAWLEKYIKSVLYVRMPEDEFVRLFTKEESWVDLERPYIISRKNNTYVFIGINKNKFRAIFKESSLTKLELYGLEKFPMLFPHYMDVSPFLKGYSDRFATAFYDGMPEEEFLKVYSGSILAHKKDWYVVQEKDGRKFQLKFSNGYLNGIAGEKAPWEH